MLLELIFNSIKSLLILIFSAIPSMDLISLPSGFNIWFGSVLSSVAYFIPVSDYLVMFSIWLLYMNFEIVWKTIQRIWDALPFT